MKKLLSLVLIVVLGVFALGINLQAQEGGVDLEEVAANSDDFYGQELALTGMIENFLSPHMFILGEDALLDNDQVLVINRSGQVFPLNIAEGSMVTVTGTIYPSRNEWSNGTFADGFLDFVIDSEVGANEYYGSLHAPNVDMNAETTPGAGAVSAVGGINWGSFDIDTTSYYYNGWLGEDYADYTVLVVTSIGSVSLAPQG